MAQTAESVVSPLEGEMSPEATEGVGATGCVLLRQMEVGAQREATPSDLPAISPSRGEITLSHALAPPLPNTISIPLSVKQLEPDAP
ncbi:hypothetical protein AJ88_40505 [Mesorhizobium amorphae CCBAU 01583]|nr:hypothetical protein AJ88_40505 [Mesorhizobium amorphae CCBAU 01583]